MRRRGNFAVVELTESAAAWPALFPELWFLQRKRDGKNDTGTRANCGATAEAQYPAGNLLLIPGPSNLFDSLGCARKTAAKTLQGGLHKQIQRRARRVCGTYPETNGFYWKDICPSQFACVFVKTSSANCDGQGHKPGGLCVRAQATPANAKLP